MINEEKLVQALAGVLQKRNKAEQDERVKAITETVAKDLVVALAPTLAEMAKSSTSNKEMFDQAMDRIVHSFADAVKDIKFEVPEVQLPTINVPQPKVDIDFDIKPLVKAITAGLARVTIKAPIVKVPPIKAPEVRFPNTMDVVLSEITRKNPLPVLLMGLDGKPFMFSQSTVGGGGFEGAGGGRGDFYTIKDIQNSSGGSLIDADGFLKITGAISVATTPFATYYSSDAVGSTNIVQLGGNPIATDMGDTSNGVQRIVSVRSPNATTTAVTIGSDGATILVPTNLSRKTIVFTHVSNANVYISTGTADSTLCFPVVANQMMGFEDYTGPITAIVEEAGGTTSVRYIEIS